MDLTLKVQDPRRFIVPSGVAALTLIDGRPRSLSGASVDYWTVLSAKSSDTVMPGEQLRAAIEQKVGSRSPVLSVVLVRPGPHSLMLEFAEVPTRAGLAVQVQLHLDVDLVSVERVLKRFLSGQSATVSSEEVERLISRDAEAAVSSALSAFGAEDLASPTARQRLLEQLRAPISQSLDGMGLAPRSMSLTRLSSEAVEEVQRERGAAELDSIRVVTLQLRSENELKNQEVLVDHVVRLETLEARKQAVLMAAATRTADGELHDLHQRERVQKLMRDMERTLQVEQVVSDADLHDLAATRQDAARREATLRSIAMRANLRDHELAELQAELRNRSLRDDSGRSGQLLDAQTQAGILSIQREGQRKQAELGMEIAKAEQAMQHDGQDRNTTRAQDAADRDAGRVRDAADAEHRRRMDQQRLQQEFELRTLELQGKLTPEQLAMIRNIDPELARALFRVDAKVAGGETLEEIRKVVANMSQSRIEELKAQVTRLEDGQGRKDDQMASQHTSTMRALVDLVGNLRTDSGRTTINVAGRPERSSRKD